MRYDALTDLVGARLEAQADEGRRDWWTRYLKGEAAFRGVTMAQVRTQVDAVWAAEVSGWPADEAKGLALAFLARQFTEDKLAGVLLLAEKLAPRLSAADLPMLAHPFEDGSVSDWGVSDWFSVKVLSPLCAHEGLPFAEPLAGWVTADGLWQRRAPAAALAPLAPKRPPFERFDELCLRVCASLVADPQRFAQTAVGWLLRELSKRRPEPVVEFVEEHADRLSREAHRMATAKVEGRGRR